MAQLFQFSRTQHERGLGGKILKSIGGAYGAGRDEDLLKKLRKKQDTEEATSDIMSVYDQKMAPITRGGAPGTTGTPVVPGASEFRSGGSEGGLPGDSISMSHRTAYEQSVREGLAGGEVDEDTAVGAAIQAYKKAHPDSSVNINDPSTLKRVGIFLANMASEDPRKDQREIRKTILDISTQAAAERDNVVKNAIDQAKVAQLKKANEINDKQIAINQQLADAKITESEAIKIKNQKELALLEEAIEEWNLNKNTRATEAKIKEINKKYELHSRQIQENQQKRVFIGGPDGTLKKHAGSVGMKLSTRLMGKDGKGGLFGKYDMEGDGINMIEAGAFDINTWRDGLTAFNEAMKEQQDIKDSYWGNPNQVVGSQPGTIINKLHEKFKDQAPGKTIENLKRLMETEPDTKTLTLISKYEESELHLQNLKEATLYLNQLFNGVQGMHIGNGTVEPEEARQAQGDIAKYKANNPTASTLEAFVGVGTQPNNSLLPIMDKIFVHKIGSPKFALSYLTGPFLDGDAKTIKNPHHIPITDFHYNLFMGGLNWKDVLGEGDKVATGGIKFAELEDFVNGILGMHNAILYDKGEDGIAPTVLKHITQQTEENKEIKRRWEASVARGDDPTKEYEELDVGDETHGLTGRALLNYRKTGIVPGTRGLSIRAYDTTKGQHSLQTKRFKTEDLPVEIEKIVKEYARRKGVTLEKAWEKIPEILDNLKAGTR